MGKFAIHMGVGMAGSATGTGNIFEFNGHYYEAVRVDVWDSTQKLDD